MARAPVVVLVGVLAAAALLDAQTLPPGWRRAAASDDRGGRVFESTDVPAGEFVRVRELPRQSLDGVPIARWVERVVAPDTPPEGRWGLPASVAAQTANLAIASREFVRASGQRGGVIYMALSVDGQLVRLVRADFSNSTLMQGTTATAAKSVMQSLASGEFADARREQRGVAVTATPPDVRGIRRGGPIVAGRYIGNLVSPRGEVMRGYTVTLYANGEYHSIDSDELLDSTGRYRYEPGTGRLDIGGVLRNNTYHPDEDFCVYGRNAAGEPVIYAEDDMGISIYRATLRRVGDATRPPPSELAADRARRRAESERYKYVTAPGAGVRPADIEAVFYEWEQVYEIGGLQMKERLHLLLTDGTVHFGLPVPPQDMDVALSRRLEPEAWGRWRRAGTGYAFARPRDPQAFRVAQGNAALPARAGSTITGRFESSSSFQIPGAAGAWSQAAYTFGADGRFSRERAGGAGMSSGAGDNTTVTGMVYDDAGSASSVSSPVAGGGSVRRTPDTGNRRGTYQLDGYSITLRYENGTVERLPFMIDPPNHRGVWLRDALYMRRK